MCRSEESFCIKHKKTQKGKTDFFSFSSAQLLGLYQKGAVLGREEAQISEKALRLEKVLGLSLVDYLPCVLRNKFYISDPTIQIKC